MKCRCGKCDDDWYDYVGLLGLMMTSVPSSAMTLKRTTKVTVMPGTADVLMVDTHRSGRVLLLLSECL